MSLSNRTHGPFDWTYPPSATLYLSYVVAALYPDLRSRSLTTVPVSKTPVLSTVLEPRVLQIGISGYSLGSTDLVTAVFLAAGSLQYVAWKWRPQSEREQCPPREMQNEIEKLNGPYLGKVASGLGLKRDIFS